MKLSGRDAAEVLSRARPAPTHFVDSTAGRDVVSTVVSTALPTVAPRLVRRRILLMLVAGVGTVVIGTGTAVAVYRAPQAPPDAQYQTDGKSIICDGGEVAVRVGESPFDACRRAWPQVFGRRAPQHLFACVAQVTTQVTPGVGPSIGTAAGVAILDGDRFGNASETCGAAHMLVAPPMSQWWPKAPAVSRTPGG